MLLKSANSVADYISERPFSAAGTSGGVTAAADHTALLNLTTGDAGHTQFLMLNGSKAMLANLDMGGFEITNVGDVDGVDVSAHAARHLPLGSDALATAAPVTDVSQSSTNSVGIQNSFARSDHSHALDVASIITQTITNGVTTTAPSEDAVFDALALKVTGPASAVDDRVAVFDGTTGKLIKDGGRTVSELLLGPQGAITVASANGDYTTLGAALAVASAGDTILVYPGTFAENNPLTVPDTVTIVAVGAAEDTILDMQNPASNGLILGEGCDVRYISVQGCTSAAGFVLDSGTIDSVLDGCESRGNQIGFLCDGAGDGNTVQDARASGTHTTTIQVQGGSQNVGFANCRFTKSTLTTTTGVLVTGSGSSASFGSVVFRGGASISVGFDVQAGGICIVNGTQITAASVVAYRVGAGTFRAAGACAATACTLDLQATDASASLKIQGGIFDEAKIDLIPTLTERPIIDFQNRFSGDEGRNILGELHVGAFDYPAEASFGGGDSTTRTMQVWSASDATTGAVFTDNTTAAASRGGSIFSMFGGTTVGRCCYIGSIPVGSLDSFLWVSMRMTVDTLGNYNRGDIVLEYRTTGGAWQDLAFMGRAEDPDPDAPEDQQQYGNSAFNQSQTLEQQVHFKTRGVTDWETSYNPGNGESGVWLRFRIVNAITTDPTLQQIKLGPSRMEINQTGRAEHHGDAEPPGLIRTFSSAPSQGQT